MYEFTVDHAYVIISFVVMMLVLEEIFSRLIMKKLSK